MNLYVLIRGNGDGSNSLVYVIDPNVIVKMEQLHDDEIMDYDNGGYVDGDGFHYGCITLPDGCTPESLGIRVMTMEDISHYDVQ